jgi:hypothetical protein
MATDEKVMGRGRAVMVDAKAGQSFNQRSHVTHHHGCYGDAPPPSH